VVQDPRVWEIDHNSSLFKVEWVGQVPRTWVALDPKEWEVQDLKVWVVRVHKVWEDLGKDHHRDQTSAEIRGTQD
jgi:hypothetical protein